MTHLNSLSFFILTHPPGFSGQVTICSWSYRGPRGSSEGRGSSLSLLLTSGITCPCTLERLLHCPFLKHILKPIFIPWHSLTLLLFNLMCWFYYFNLINVFNLRFFLKFNLIVGFCFCHVKCTGLCFQLVVVWNWYIHNFFPCLLTGKLKNQFYSLLSVDHLFLTVSVWFSDYF